MKTYEQLRPLLQSFDVICCNHKDWFWNLIGHTAMLVKDDTKNLLMVWQSTSIYAGTPGTSLSFFNEWLTLYPGKVFVRRMSMPESVRIMAEIKLNEYITIYRNKPYPDLHSILGLRYMMNQVLDIFPWNKNPVEVPGEARDCSDRIAHTLKWCGLLTENCNPSEIEPDDFRDRKMFHHPIDKYLMPRVVLGKEEQLK